MAQLGNYHMAATLIQERLTLVLEYERIKNKDSKRHFKRVKDLEKYSCHQRKVIWKWYNIFISSNRKPESLFPRKRGPKDPHGKPPKKNGKIEAFWKIIKREFLTKYIFKDWREFNLKLHQYMYHYNQERKHGGIKYLSPVQKLNLINNSSEITKSRANKIKLSSKNNGRVDDKPINDFKELPIHFVTELVSNYTFSHIFNGYLVF